MKFMVTPYFKAALAILLTLIATACTTSSRLIQSEISVKHDAIPATNTPPRRQEDALKAEPSDTINPKDSTRSLSQLRSLAEQGQASAQYSLGYVYYNGLGVPRNESAALTWFASAAQQGNEKALEALRRIAIAIASSAKAQQVEVVKVVEPMPESRNLNKPLSLVKKAQVSPTAQLPEVSTDTMARTLTGGGESSLTRNEQWIMDQSGKRFTIQLVATGNKSAMKRFISSHNLGGNAVYYKTKRKNDDWYTLILGSYESLTAAQQKLTTLSPALRKTKPWVKPISGIQKVLTAR